MFLNYLHVDVLGNVGLRVVEHLLGVRGWQPLKLHVSVVGDEDLDVRLVVHVLHPRHGGPVLHHRRPVLVPLVTCEPVLHVSLVQKRPANVYRQSSAIRTHPKLHLDLCRDGDLVCVLDFVEVRPMPRHHLGPVVEFDKARVVLLNQEAQHAIRTACTTPAHNLPASAQVSKKNC